MRSMEKYCPNNVCDLNGNTVELTQEKHLDGSNVLRCNMCKLHKIEVPNPPIGARIRENGFCNFTGVDRLSFHICLWIK